MKASPSLADRTHQVEEKQGPDPERERPKATVRDYLRMVFRRKHALVLPAFLGVLLVLPIWFAIPPKYEAVA